MKSHLDTRASAPIVASAGARPAREVRPKSGSSEASGLALRLQSDEAARSAGVRREIVIRLPEPEDELVIDKLLAFLGFERPGVSAATPESWYSELPRDALRLPDREQARAREDRRRPRAAPAAARAAGRLPGQAGARPGEALSNAAAGPRGRRGARSALRRSPGARALVPADDGGGPPRARQPGASSGAGQGRARPGRCRRGRGPRSRAGARWPSPNGEAARLPAPAPAGPGRQAEAGGEAACPGPKAARGRGRARGQRPDATQLEQDARLSTRASPRACPGRACPNPGRADAAGRAERQKSGRQAGRKASQAAEARTAGGHEPAASVAAETGNLRESGLRAELSAGDRGRQTPPLELEPFSDEWLAWYAERRLRSEFDLLNHNDALRGLVPPPERRARERARPSPRKPPGRR